MTAQQKPITLSLVDIAAWQFNYLTDTPPAMIAGLPSLQRGAVWKAGQVELLWDSILRGFPIGALVVCQKLEGQGTRSGRHGKGWADAEVGYHLLDGQQRCNGIALGFADALAPLEDGSMPPATLWLDLAPNMPKDSTRQFMLRMLTTAHPWGYTAADQAGYLSVPAIREAVNGGKRLPIIKSIPHQSSVPVPFSWLVHASLIQRHAGEAMWSAVLSRCAAVAPAGWATTAAEMIRKHLSGTVNRHLQRIEAGMRNAQALALVALQVPQTALDEPSHQEEVGEKQSENTRIHHVEHLFHRLNSAGTELRGEELLFSLIKAYWPAIERSFDHLRDKNGIKTMPMPQSRLALLGARAGLLSLSKTASAPALTISKIRALASDPAASAERNALSTYLGIFDDGRDPAGSDLHLNLRQIDQWLLWDDSAENDLGIPAVLRSALAQDAPEVFLLLLRLAQKVRDDGTDSQQIAALRKPILGLVTVLHWFGLDLGVAVAALYPALLESEPLTAGSFSKVLEVCTGAREGRRSILNILTPDQMELLIPAVDAADTTLHDWRFWTKIVASDPDPLVRAERENNEWQFMSRLLYSKALLIYAQRNLFGLHFSDFDPSHVDIREGKNRPWDYDHLLTSDTLGGNPRTYREACKQWGWTIGNFRAWPLEENRSRRNELANASITTPEASQLSLIVDAEECDAFSLGWDDLESPQFAAGFMNAARSRMLRIYRHWYETLDVAALYAPAGQSWREATARDEFAANAAPDAQIS